MAISIQTNLNSLIAQENLRVNSNFQSQTIQRLTSGYRINQSGDDAAGLAIANKFRSDTAELTQGVRNANDGISQLQIIDGGLNNVSQMLNRMKTLATQSASSTFTGDRSTLNSEYSKLLQEIDRQAANIGLGGAGTTDQGRLVQQLAVYLGGASKTQTNGSVTIDLSSARVDSTTLGVGTSNINGTVTMQDVGAVALNTGGKWLANTSQTFQISTATTDTTFTISGGSNGLSKDEFLSSLNANLAGSGVAASINSTTGVLTMGSSKGFVFKAAAAGVPAENAVTANTYEKNTTDTYKYNMGTVQNYDAAGGSDDTFSFALAVNGTASGTVTLDGTDATVDQIFSMFKTAAGTSGLEVIRQGNNMYLQGNKSFSVTAAFAVGGNAADNRTQSPFATAGFNANAAAETGSVGTTAAGSQTSAALDALTKITTALSALGTVQGTVGAGQNRLAYAIGLAQSQISSFSAAESRIRDADVAEEAANLTKAQVLQQASIAAMAQANSAPQAVLALLRG